MLTQYQVTLIRRLLALGTVRQRQIAWALGISLSAVQSVVARDKREWFGKADSPDEPPVMPRRCSSCGAWVYPPCLICKTGRFFREHPDRKAGRAPMAAPIIVGLDLLPRHFARYEQVRRRRRKREEALFAKRRVGQTQRRPANDRAEKENNRRRRTKSRVAQAQCRAAKR